MKNDVFLKGRLFIWTEGKIVEDFGYAGLEVKRFAKLEIKRNPVME